MPKKEKVNKYLRRMGLTAKQQKGVKKIAKSVAMEIPEKKVFGFREENIDLFHNKALYLSSWLSCKEGTADDNDGAANRLIRIGDELYLRNINIRFWLSNKLDRPNVMYKLFLFWYDSKATLSDV